MNQVQYDTLLLSIVKLDSKICDLTDLIMEVKDKTLILSDTNLGEEILLLRKELNSLKDEVNA